LEIERIEIGTLISDPSNTRKHPERNLQTIVGSLHRFGQQKPIVIDKANIVRAGNGTLEAARSMGWTHLDCVRTQLQSSDAIAYAISDNRTAELAEWDDDVLAAQLNGLLADDEKLFEATGFSEDELEKLLGEINETPELNDKPVLDPPVMSWVLIGIPTVRFAEVAADVERLAGLPDIIIETTSNGG
jgi:ParB-like chromosome segregation protein Spo0J